MLDSFGAQVNNPIMGSLSDKVVVIGAGMGGLAAAIRLAAAGCDVTVVEQADAPGGKMRTMPSDAGPVDAGPTVLTMLDVFDDLFAAAGTTVAAHLDLIPQPVIARHWWPNGAKLDLHPDRNESAAAVRAFGGPEAEGDFRRFCGLSEFLYDAFDGPMMRAERPHLGGIVRGVALRPRIWPALVPGVTLQRLLAKSFRDPRLAQLFGRYATYVGGSPDLSPAVLALIWHAEERGVWAVRGGMQRLAQAMADIATAQGVTFRHGTRAERILIQGDRVSGIRLEDGSVLPCTHTVFNGDPAALYQGFLGPETRHAVPAAAITQRSHSAWVWSFAARASGLPLAMHNVLFSGNPADEFAPLNAGKEQTDPSIYICAQDRAGGTAPDGPERFEIILNAPPTDRDRSAPDRHEVDTCLTRTFATLERFGLTFDPLPGAASLTGPPQFRTLFPGSAGSIYGRSPHGLLAAFRRTTAASMSRRTAPAVGSR
jgi:1-hydroxycarotenoid 3,4-desaturase